MVANNNLNSSWIINQNHEREEIKILNNKISHEFILNEFLKFSVFCLDENYIPNINIFYNSLKCTS